MIGDDPTPFFDLGGFSVEVTFVSADTLTTVVTTGIHEEAVTEETNTGRAGNSAFQPQITVPRNVTSQFGEDDTVKFIPQGEVALRTFIILDDFHDSIQTTFSLHES